MWGRRSLKCGPQMERVEDVLQYKTDVPADFAEEPGEKLRGDIELSHITFGYSPLSDPLLKDFSMDVKAGGSVAFVGASGSGKSTLAKLIAGLYTPWQGEILLDGKPREAYPPGTLPKSLSVVDQEIILFEDTVANNITMWDPGISQAEVVAACKAAEIHEDIVARPEGYGLILREGGQNFSGGQRQRLEIARALVTNPSILILDEATSALDARTRAEDHGEYRRREGSRSSSLPTAFPPSGTARRSSFWTKGGSVNGGAPWGADGGPWEI